jgi:hypothetical protein
MNKMVEEPSKITYNAISVIPMKKLPEDPIPEGQLKSMNFYGGDDKNVFFRHYWLQGEPSL